MILDVCRETLQRMSAYAGRDAVPFAFVAVSGFVVLASVAWKYVQYGDSGRKTSAVRFHPVETISMTLVAGAIVGMMFSHLGLVSVDPFASLLNRIWGGGLIAIAVWLHVWSKFAIGKQWSNDIEIIEHHAIVTTGPYAYVRHPMYSSLVLWLLACAWMFGNATAFAAVVCLYFPAMVWRARAEERMLSSVDASGYAAYAQGKDIMIPHAGQYFSAAVRWLLLAFLAIATWRHSMSVDVVCSLVLQHALVGLTAHEAKVRFAYRNKSLFLLVIFGLTCAWPAAWWLYWFIILTNFWGMFGNCPCMFVYEKYHRCPCLDWIKKAVCDSNVRR